MKDAVKFALLAVAAYLIARNFGIVPDLFAQPQATPAAEEPPPPPPPAPSASAVLVLMKAAAIEAGYSDSLGWDQWNWFYNAITGKEAPAPEAVGIPRVDPMPNIAAETWYEAIAAGGFAL